MSEAKHTPGPWFVSDRPSGHWSEVAAGEPGGVVILFPSSASWLSLETRQANARLAAAAPDLLAALRAGLSERALNCSFSGQADDPFICCCGKPKTYHWKAMAREAIAKTEAQS